MQKFIRSRILWGILLILAGIFAFFANVGFPSSKNIIWIVLSVLGALFFFSFILENRRNWWAFIPGVSLLGVALVNLVGLFSPSYQQEWGESILFAVVGISFLVVYLYDTANWWAILPAGVLFSLSVVAGLANLFSDRDLSGLYLLGLGTTFFMLAILPNKAGKMVWAWIPTFILLIMGTIELIAPGELVVYLVSFAIITIGLLLIIRAVRRSW
jgi:predicted lysophospholipase L1 biosynthesis ABC-type transport system permease subunit